MEDGMVTHRDTGMETSFWARARRTKVPQSCSSRPHVITRSASTRTPGT